ncbi:type IV pilus modification PilV family protein [Saccharospirillum impatiens]|uniref:type IV pilus modification PilV family protein n=1 Tax=Saccharospirillum impatiens TaxID=169438 RepID=UPI000416DC13|nr:prepilin-type N-terminal cleavage/methylation domain-containing protein [Saccharospirillum impatiens]
MTRSFTAQRGVTLIELIITVVIIAIALAGTIVAFSNVVGRSSDTLFQSRAIALAQAYLDEILGQPFDQATPEGGAPPYMGSCRVIGGDEDDRDTFRSVDQYDGLVFSPPELASGAISEGYEGYTVSISVSCVDTSAELGDGDIGQAKRIDVSISSPTNQTAVFSAYRSNF